ncbi:MAG: peptidoglycan-binding domain-containing protein, partial [Alphaproteobacteria bacterium]
MLPAAAQSVYVYPRYYGPPAYYAPPPAYVYRPPARYYAPPATYAPYAPPPPVEYDYPHRTYPHAPERTQRDSGAVAPTYQPPLVAPDFQQPLVVAIQQELSARGYDPGPATGAVDARTASAIRRYQQDVGLPVTGQASQGLL